MTQDVRLEQLKQWVCSFPEWENAVFEPASADASFRRYFRGAVDGRTAIIMDAPPDKEDSTSFVDVTERLLEAGIRVPRLLAKNRLDGFLLLDDFGSTLLLDQLDPASVDDHYQRALQTLLQLQLADSDHLPVYNEELLMQEMALMPEWFLRTHLQFTADDLPLELIDETLTALQQEVSSQPQAFVHRDYHSRNLMLLSDGELGVIDYQDAVLGPVTYDLVSLLRDCYIAWPEQRVYRWVSCFHKEAIAAGNFPPVDERSFVRWFDLTGLQRHIKVLGIFSRLHHRDGKSGYLKDLPLVLSYVLKVGARHPETSRFVEWLRSSGITERVGTVSIPA